jgi:hypothetical protein
MTIGKRTALARPAQVPADHARRHPLLALRLGYSRQRPAPVRAPDRRSAYGRAAREGLPIDALGRLERSELRIAKTASRHILGVMNQMALEIGWHTDQAGGLWSIDVDELNL